MIKVDDDKVMIYEGENGTMDDVLVDVAYLLKGVRDALKEHGMTDPDITAIYIQLVRLSTMSAEDVAEDIARMEKEDKEEK